jgi:hypothetical protein
MAARVEFLDLPAALPVVEDEEMTLAFEIINRGNVETAYRLTAETNLRETLIDRTGSLPSGKRERFTCRVVGRYRTGLDRNPVADGTLTTVFVRLEHADLSGKMTQPNYGRQTVPVEVKPRPTKIDTDALKAFDNL